MSRPTAYVCTSGQFSDYHIDYVFLNRGEAEAYCALTDANLEEYEVGIPDEVRIVRTLVCYGTKADKSIRTVTHQDGSQSLLPPERVDEYENHQDVTGLGSEFFEVETELTKEPWEFLEQKVKLVRTSLEGAQAWLHVEGENFERVRKAFSERWAQLLAEWPLIRQAAMDGHRTWPIQTGETHAAP